MSDLPFQSAEEAQDNFPLHRIDIYSGPPTLNCLAPGADNLDDKSLTPSTRSKEPPLLPPKASRSHNLTLYPLNSNSGDSCAGTNQLVRSANIRAAMGNEEIVMSSSPAVENSLNQPRRRETQRPPDRPPKPKQYIIRPATDNVSPNPQIEEKRKEEEEPSHARKAHRKRASKDTHTMPRKKEKRRAASKDYRPEEKRKQKSRSKPRCHSEQPAQKDEEKQERKTKTLQRPRTHKAQEQSQKGEESNDATKKLDQLRQEEELLKQIIQGIREAEMLQSKIERTRNWTTEQKNQVEKKAQRRITIAHDDDGKLRKREAAESKRNKSFRHKSVT